MVEEEKKSEPPMVLKTHQEEICFLCERVDINFSKHTFSNPREEFTRAICSRCWDLMMDQASNNLRWSKLVSDRERFKVQFGPVVREIAAKTAQKVLRHWEIEQSKKHMAPVGTKGGIQNV